MKIAWLGTGVMGQSMAANLLMRGHVLTVFSRTSAKASGLVARGAQWANSPGEAAIAAEVVCSMVGYPADVEEVLLGPDGALQSMRPGALCIDFTTSSPGLAVKIFEAAKKSGIAALDAPVSGGDIGAREGKLSIMVGGELTAFERALPIFQCLGKTIVLQGGPGAGQHAKMVNQIMIAGTMLGMCEGLLYARQAKLNPETVLASIGGGAAASWSLANLYPRILKEDFSPGFFVEHFVKDLRIALGEAKRMQLSLPALALAEKLYAQLEADGGARLGTQALTKQLETAQVK
ncbi:MAG: NAD(P)-dependent oxidoreductase [Kiritimatiellia bacterium]|nr:NAD(P)-dependent oxidoreductase [Kiritimatiellia bacterium]